MGVLEVSRSIGDGPYKNHGLTCLPDIKRCQLNENDRLYLVISLQEHFAISSNSSWSLHW